MNERDDDKGLREIVQNIRQARWNLLSSLGADDPAMQAAIDDPDDNIKLQVDLLPEGPVVTLVLEDREGHERELRTSTQVQ